jgi:hypothetical protein
MKTLYGRIEDVSNTGKTNMDGYNPDECLSIAKELTKVLGKKCVWSGVTNEIASYP